MLGRSLVEKRKGWPHDMSWPQPDDLVRYAGSGNNVRLNQIGTVKRVFEGGKVEVYFLCGTTLVGDVADMKPVGSTTPAFLDGWGS